MRVHEIENWALSVIDRVKSGQPVEDTRVELKSKWPDPQKAARRIAGHANAARGAPILWLIGVDEKSREVPGADMTEFTDWFNSVRACYDELPPQPVEVNVPVDSVTVVAIFFETTRAPFVVKNPVGGAIQREVPWRETTEIKSATRSQLLRLLSPIQNQPVIEEVSALLRAEKVSSNGDAHWDFKAYLALFLYQPEDQQIVIPKHRCGVSLLLPTFRYAEVLKRLEFRGNPDDRVTATGTSLRIQGSGLFEVRFTIAGELGSEPSLVDQPSAQITFSFDIAHSDQTMTQDFELSFEEPLSDQVLIWGFGNKYRFIEDPLPSHLLRAFQV